MAERQLEKEARDVHEQQIKTEDDQSLKGTFVSVGFVGAVIVVMWVAVFGLYMIRV